MPGRCSGLDLKTLAVLFNYQLSIPRQRLHFPAAAYRMYTFVYVVFFVRLANAAFRADQNLLHRRCVESVGSSKRRPKLSTTQSYSQNVTEFKSRLALPQKTQYAELGHAAPGLWRRLELLNNGSSERNSTNYSESEPITRMKPAPDWYCA